MQRQWYWGLIFIICAGLLSGPALAANALVNVGVLSLRNDLMVQGDFIPKIYPRYDVLPDNASQSHTVERLRRAVDLDSGSYAARWALGRAALAVGDAETAAAALASLADQHQNPFLYGDALIALGRVGQYERVTELYESASPPQPMQTISDTVVLAYLEQGDRDALERAIALRPGDLYANYFLWKWAQEEKDIAAIATYSETLVHFSLEAIDPPDERFLDYAVEVIPDLLEEGLWDRDKTLNVVSFLVWQHNGARGVERLLGQLIERYPAEPDWPFYLAELYHRRGNLAQAEAAYRQVLAVDPTYVQAYLRLGMVAEAGREGESLSEAARWYAQYHSLAPDDLLGLERLVEVCTMGKADVEDPSCRETVTLREELDSRTDDRRIVAELLGVPVEDVELGPNLVENGGFEEWEDIMSPVGWRVGAYLGQSRNEGLYVAGQDTLVAGEEMARIIALWGGVMPDGTTTYAEYAGDTLVVTNTKYFVSLHYAFRHLEGTGLVFLGEYTRLDGSVFVHASLPNSYGQWTILHLLFDGPPAPTAVMPLVRNWGIGQLWVRVIEIRPVTYVKGP